MLHTFLLFVISTAAIGLLAGQGDAQSALRQLCMRQFPELASKVEFQIEGHQAKAATFSYRCAGDRLTITASDPNAAARGLYTYVKQELNGIRTWSGSRRIRGEKLKPALYEMASSPYSWRLRDNVCAFGYTSPYWDWARWEQELDWMALHGYNLMMAPSGSEAIWDEVWQSLGFTQGELDRFFAGGAFLPWHRMGNINAHGYPLNARWHKGQIQLQHRILDRMKELGIRPIIPAFAGFIPASYQTHFPKDKIHTVKLWAGFPAKNQTYILDPLSPNYQALGKRYIEAYEREFGKQTHYLADSFNELEVPVPVDRQERLKTLANYGLAVYSSITAGNPEATWVMQSWAFSFLPKFWDKESAFALLSRVPQDRMLLLDLCQELWKGYEGLDFYQGKPWIVSYIPTWGGNNLPGGPIEFYRTDPSAALSKGTGHGLVGFGVSGEGFENNELLYELLSDSAWSTKPLPRVEWLNHYWTDRYGASDPALLAAWEQFESSCFTRDSANLRHAYMMRPRDISSGEPLTSFPAAGPFESGVELFLSCATRFRQEPLYVADAIEYGTQVLAKRGENMLIRGMQLEKEGKLTQARAEQKAALNLWREVDRLLQSHPVYRLDRWIKFARKWGRNSKEADRYEEDAKRIVTTWGGFLSEYAAKHWAGLIRSYYVPRWQAWLTHHKDPTFKIQDWEEAWITAPGLSRVKPFKNPLDALIHLLKTTKEHPDERSGPLDAGHLQRGSFTENQPSGTGESIDDAEAGQGEARRQAANPVLWADDARRLKAPPSPSVPALP